MSTAYQKAGVNIEAGYDAVARMKPHVERTRRKGALGTLGGFGGIFDLSELNMTAPVLVSGTDGVGTKLLLAMLTQRYDTIGQDVVAMCVNDVVVQGAEPLYFLDYIACGRAIPERLEQIVKGVADGCALAGCALIGGETAEMPGLYDEDEFDLAGFAVGAVEKPDLLTGDAIQPGDALIGLASSGVHSNGFSLVRRVLLEEDALSRHVPALQTTLGDALLTPTRIYVNAMLAGLKAGHLSGAAHITGGGFFENIPRMLPEGLGAEIDPAGWPLLPIFELIRQAGDISLHDMYSTFNMGIGMVLAVPQSKVDAAMALFEAQGEMPYRMGTVTEQAGVRIQGVNV